MTEASAFCCCVGLGGTRNDKDAPRFMGRVADGEVYDQNNAGHRERERSRERERERDRDRRCAIMVRGGGHVRSGC